MVQGILTCLSSPRFSFPFLILFNAQFSVALFIVLWCIEILRCKKSHSRFFMISFRFCIRSVAVSCDSLALILFSIFNSLSLIFGIFFRRLFWVVIMVVAKCPRKVCKSLLARWNVRRNRIHLMLEIFVTASQRRETFKWIIFYNYMPCLAIIGMWWSCRLRREEHLISSLFLNLSLFDLQLSSLLDRWAFEIDSLQSIGSNNTNLFLSFVIASTFHHYVTHIHKRVASVLTSTHYVRFSLKHKALHHAAQTILIACYVGDWSCCLQKCLQRWQQSNINLAQWQHHELQLNNFFLF